MEERTVRVNYGDWSDDGHGQTEVVLFRLRGKDVSDSALASSYEKVVDLLDRDLSDVCSEYEENSVSLTFYETLLEHGFVTDTTVGHWPAVGVQGLLEDPTDEYSELHIGANELLMFYVGRFIEDFEWEIVEEEIPVLLGGFNTIVKQGRRAWGSSAFGYGLFYS